MFTVHFLDDLYIWDKKRQVFSLCTNYEIKIFTLSGVGVMFFFLKIIYPHKEHESYIKPVSIFILPRMLKSTEQT